MSILYNCHTDGTEYRITKFNDGEVESSYLCSESECQCPAGSRPTCRHRLMLPMFLNRGAVDTFWFLDFERKGWVSNEPASIESWRETAISDIISPNPLLEELAYSERSELGSHTSSKPYDAFDYTNRSELGSSNLEPANTTTLHGAPIEQGHLDLLYPTKPSWRRI